MIVLPLACTHCGKRVDILSCQPMPRCEDCHGKLRPAGATRPATPDEERHGVTMNYDDVPLGAD